MLKSDNPLRSVRSEVLVTYRPEVVDFDELDSNLLSVCGDNLRQLRAELGWTQSDCGEVMGISASQYRKYEGGRDFMKMGRAALLMRQTGVPFTFLFARSRYASRFGRMAVTADMLPFQILSGTVSSAQFRAYCLQVASVVPGADNLPADLSGASWPDPDKVATDIDDYYRLVARGLRYLREVLGLTQEGLAALLNLNVRTYSQYECECGPSQFNVVQALHLWMATGVPPLWATYPSSFYQMRLLQHERMAWLCPFLKQLLPAQRQAMADLARLLRSPAYLRAASARSETAG